MKLIFISSLVVTASAWCPSGSSIHCRDKISAARGMREGAGDESYTGTTGKDSSAIGRRQLFSLAAVTFALGSAPLSSRALEIKITLPDPPELPTLPSLDDIASSVAATGEALTPEFIK